MLAACSGSVSSPGGAERGAISHSPRASDTPTYHATQPRPTPAPSATPAHPRPRTDAGIPAADLPRPALTPGVILTVSRARVCTSGYASSIRDVSDADKAAVYARYGVEWVPYQHEVDHLISLELGGSNAIRNLWPEPYAGRWGARTKDALENRLHELVCEGRLPLRSAQRQEARNWVAAYRRYVGAPPSAGSSPGPSSGGFYASSYPTASTIYCAEDPAWHDLSKTYLVHFTTFAQAKARFPGYHLHRSC